jgi:tetratricopeptide (TPR) repeat protein
MSDPIIKGVKRPASRPTTRSAAPAPSAKNRKLSAKSARPKPLAKRPTTKKAPVRKATKAGATVAKPTRSASAAAKTITPKTKRAPVTKKASAPNRKTAKPSSKTSAKPSARATAKKQPPKRVSSAPANKVAAKPHATKKVAAPPRPTHTPRQPTQDEAAALRAFERAHKEFARGRFAEARMLFRALIEQHAGVAEVTARSRTYLAIAEARLRSESSLPRNAEELYDRGVIELNRGEYVAAQEMFERALRREPDAAHIHYGLAATRSRLGSIDLALQALARALQLQPNLRLRAQHDQDLLSLRNDPEYERIVYAPRP